MIILHGLFGSSDNWYTLAKTFAQHFTVYVVDQRNHGQSPHSDAFDYALLTEDLRDFIQEHSINRPIILGHSMGGKAAMNFAVRYPEELSNLIVVDIVPKKYPVHHDAILEGLTAIRLQTLTSRNEADSILASHVPEHEVRQFLLKNLSRKTGGGFEWKVNLDAIQANLPAMGDGMVFSGKYDNSSLFVMGKKSNYYEEGDAALIREIFPKMQLVMMDTGHWVSAEKPEEFGRIVLNYLAK